MADITGANAVFTLSISSLFPFPVQLQGFAADDVTDNEPVTPTEHYMGVDGILSAGHVFVPVVQAIAIQADSASNDIFDQWHQQQAATRSVFFADGVLILTALGSKWALTNGILSTYPTMPNVRKLLQPRKYGITWESVTPAVA